VIREDSPGVTRSIRVLRWEGFVESGVKERSDAEIGDDDKDGLTLTSEWRESRSTYGTRGPGTPFPIPNFVKIAQGGVNP